MGNEFGANLEEQEGICNMILRILIRVPAIDTGVP